MSSLNKVEIIGRLGQDPELKYLPSGGAVVNLSVATSEKWTDKNGGGKQERTEWHRITAYGKLAEIIGEYLRKGSQVYIEGRLQTRKWQDKDGSDRYSTEIVAREMVMLGGRSDGGGSGERRQTQGQQRQEQPMQSAVDAFDDDIPF